MKKSIFLFFVLIFNLCLSPVVYAADFADPFPLPELTGDWRTDYVAVAESQLGYNEAADGSSYFGAWGDDPYQAWCSEFASWCGEQANIPSSIIPRAWWCGDWYDFFTYRDNVQDRYFYLKEGIDPKKSNFIENYYSEYYDVQYQKDVNSISINEAEPGDLILMETDGDITNGPDHTAIFLSYEDGVVNIISGNSGNSVRYGTVSLDKIHILCKPDFENEDVDLIREAYAALDEAESEETDADEDEIEDISQTEEQTSAKEVNVTIGSSEVIIGDETLSMDAAPYIQQSSNSVLVPLRFVSTAILGISDDITEDSLNILWDSDTKTATIMFDSIDFGSKIIQFTAGSSNMVINGTTIAMDSNVKAELTNGRMFVPFRALGTALGVNVSWDSDNRIASYTVQ
ncbi:MAG: hypothetical protein LUC97_04345 [Clostridiales bacterium]|nr:hypothetical protein [Clostridiales bacterium]